MIENLDFSDFEWMNEIHLKSFGKNLSPSDFKEPYKIIGIRQKAYMIYTNVLDEAEIIYIAVADEYKRQGIAKKIIQSLCADIFLDVNENNTPAINLYKSCGFIEYQRRKNYYHDADAILMKYERK